MSVSSGAGSSDDGSSISTNKRRQSSSSSSSSSGSPCRPSLLSSGDHAVKVLESLNLLFLNGHLCDYTIIAEGEKFQCHRNLLVSVSDYFRVMLTGSMLEARQDHVELKGVTADAVRQLLHFVYTGKLLLNLDSVAEILAGACHLQIEAAVKLCAKYLQNEMSTKTVVDTLNLGDMFSLHELRTVSLKYLCSHFENIRMELLQRLSLNCMMDVLQEDGLTVSDELALFQTVERWIEAQDTFNDPSQLLRHVRFALIKPEELVDKVAKSPIIEQDSKSKSFLEEAFHYHLLPARQPLIQTSRTQVRNHPCLVAFGGRSVPNHGLNVGYHQNSNNMYALHRNEWVPLPNSTVKFLYAAVVTVDNFMYVCGGMGKPAHATSACFRFDPRNLTWTKLNDMLTRRQSFPLVSLEKKLYAFGGGTLKGKSAFHPATGKSEVYCIKRDKWSYVKDLPVKCKSAAACVFKNDVYICGGRSDEDNLCTLWKYSPLTDTYETKSPLVTALAGHAMVISGDVLFAVDRRTMQVQGYNIGIDQWFQVESKPKDMIGVGRPTVYGNHVYFISVSLGDSKTGDPYQCVSHDVNTGEQETIRRYPSKVHCVMGTFLSLPHKFLVDANNNDKIECSV